MADPDLPDTDPTEDPTLLDQARRAMAIAEGVVARTQSDPDWALQLEALGSTPAAVQRSYLQHATAAGVVACAEALDRIAGLLAARNELLGPMVDAVTMTPGVQDPGRYGYGREGTLRCGMLRDQTGRESCVAPAGHLLDRPVTEHVWG